MKSLKNLISIVTIIAVLLFSNSIEAQIDLTASGNSTVMPELILPSEMLPTKRVSLGTIATSKEYTTIEKPIVTKKFSGKVTVTYDKDYKVVAITVPSRVKKQLIAHYAGNVVNTRESCPFCYENGQQGDAQGILCAIDCVAEAITTIIFAIVDMFD